MKILQIITIALFGIISNLPANNNNLYVEPEMRNRLEFRSGYRSPAHINSTPSIFISQRTRLSLGYKSSNFKLKLSPQDIRVWGDEAKYNNSLANNSSLNLYEGFAEVKMKNSRLTIGRQNLNYDNNWLLAKRNWLQQGISTDAIVFKTEYNNYKIHLAGSWNSLQESNSNIFYPANRYKTLNYLWANREFSNTEISFLHISTGQTKSDTSNHLNLKHTTGYYLNTKINDFGFSGNAYYQYGRNQSGNMVSAYLLYANLSYMILNLNAEARVTFLSGINRSTSDKIIDNNFDLILGGNRKYLGFMNYFVNYKFQENQTGLVDYTLNLNYNIRNKVILRNKTHFFSMLYDNDINNFLGMENDFIVRIRLDKWSALDFGYMFFLPTEHFKSIQNIDEARFPQYAFMQISINPDRFIFSN